MPQFDLFIGIDYSGAQTPTSRLPGLKVYTARRTTASCEKWLSPAKSNNGGAVNWTRREIAHVLLAQARSAERFLAGIDHCFSFPESYFQRYGLKTWPAFLDDFVHHWPTDGADMRVDSVRHGVAPREHGAPPSAQRTGKSDEFRITERWTSSAKSVFQFGVQGSVAMSSHAGIPWLKWLRDQTGDRLHFWPFDGWAPAAEKSVIVEVYPSIFRNRYERGDRTGDEQDAYATARWMADMDSRGALAEYFTPPLIDSERFVAAREGWIFGTR